METIPLTKARYNLKNLVRRASAGETFVLSERGEKKAAIVPLSKVEKRSPREVKEFMDKVDKLRKKITADLRRKGFKKTSVEMIREMREEN